LLISSDILTLQVSFYICHQGHTIIYLCSEFYEPEILNGEYTDGSGNPPLFSAVKKDGDRETNYITKIQE